MARRVLEVAVVGDATSLKRALGSAGGSVDKFGRRAEGGRGKFAAMGAAMGRAAKVGVLAVGAAAVTAGPKIISLASDAEETASKFKTVFGRETNAAIRNLNAFSKATGTSKFALREQAAQFQALIRPMGLTTKEAGGMSIGMTKLATDLASFNNTSVEEAITALQSGLVGEAEPMRRFGVQLSANRVKAFAYANGIAKSGEELTAAQKAQASYGIILEDTKLAQGDATRTADSFANRFKRLKSQVTDAATELGVKLLPVVTDVVGAISEFIDGMRDGEGVGSKFVRVLKDAVEVYKDYVSALRDGVVAAVNAFGDALDFVRGFIREHRDDIEALGEAFTNIGKIIAGVAAFAFRRVLVPALNFALSVLKRLLPAVKQVGQGLIRILGGVADFFAGVFTLDLGRAWDGIKAIFSGALKALGGIIRGATAGIREAGAKVGAALIDGIKSIPRALADAGKWILTTFAKAVKTWLRAYADLGRWVLDAVRDGLKSAGRFLSDAADWIFKTAKRAVESALNSYRNIGRWILDKLRDGIKSAGSFLGDAADWVVRKFTGFVRNIPQGLLNIGRWITARVREGLKSAGEFVDDAANWLARRFTGALRAIPQGLLNVGRWVTARVREGIKGVGEFLDDAAGWAVRRLRGGFSAVRDSVIGIGSWIVSRVKEGILAVPNLLKDAAKWLKDKLIGFVKGFLGIKSPSKVMMQLGGHIVEGLVKGIFSSASNVKDVIVSTFGSVPKLAAELLKSQVIDVASLPVKGIKKLGGFLGDALGIGGGGKGDAGFLKGVGGLRLVAIGRMLQGMGYNVSEHPAFGGVRFRHAPNSFHFRGRAIDVNADNFPGGEPAALDRLHAILRRIPHAELLWRVADHFDHLHFAMASGGVSPGGIGLVGERGPEIAALPRGTRVLSARETRETLSAAPRGGGVTVNMNGPITIGSRQGAHQMGHKLAWRVATAAV